MSDNVLLILNTISIAVILLLTAYLSSIVDRKQLRLFNAIYYYFKGDNTKWNHTWLNRRYLWLYLLIPSMLTMAIVLISQMGLGNLKIRLDIQFYIQTCFWISLAFTFKDSYK